MARDAVADYLSAGETFVALVDGISESDRDRLLGDLAIALADLYGAAGRLPSTEVEGDSLVLHSIGTGPFFATLCAVEDVLDEPGFGWGLDWEYHDLRPENVDERWKVVLDLANNLAEPWQDVKSQVAGLRAGARLGDAIYEVREEFWPHTSNHVIGALRILHARLADDGGPRPPHNPGQ